MTELKYISRVEYLKREKVLSEKKTKLLVANHYCRGCMTPRQLTLSHLIKRSRRNDLILDDKNLTIHCAACHRKWEVKDPFAILMLDFHKNLKLIKEMDSREYDEWLYIIRKN